MKSRIDRFHLGMADGFIVIVALCDAVDVRVLAVPVHSLRTGQSDLCTCQ